MNTPEELKLPHDDFSVLPFEWGSWEYLLLIAAASVLVLFIYLGVRFYQRWMDRVDEQSHSLLQLLRKEAMQLQVESQVTDVDYSHLYGEFSRILRCGIDEAYQTSLSAWNFREISENSDFVSKYLGTSTHKILGFLGRADRCIYSGNHVDITILKQDKKLVVETMDQLCQLEQSRLEAKK